MDAAMQAEVEREPAGYSIDTWIIFVYQYIIKQACSTHRRICCLKFHSHFVCTYIHVDYRLKCLLQYNMLELAR